jgi:hypothetical protein
MKSKNYSSQSVRAFMQKNDFRLNSRAKTFLLITFTLVLLICGISVVQAAARRAIPRNLSEAHQSLAEYLTPAEIIRIKQMRFEHEVLQVIGLPQAAALTNKWRLWGNSPLARYFRGLGVAEPHDMIGIVAQTYWCKLHGTPFRLEAKVAKLRADYARQRTVKPEARSPRDGARIDWLVTRESATGNLYLGISQTDGSFWRYDDRNRAGVEPARPDEAGELARLVQAGKELSQ